MQENNNSIDDAIEDLKVNILREDAYRSEEELSSEDSRERIIFSTRRKQYARKLISEKHTKELMSLITEATDKFEKDKLEVDHHQVAISKINDPNLIIKECNNERFVIRKVSNRVYTPLSKLI